jgi:hypothetical protein
MSSDNSVELALAGGCEVKSFDTKNSNSEPTKMRLRNNVWKTIQSGWIIMADMDEFLCITEDELKNETAMGTTILKTIGHNMFGESKTTDLSDINLQDITKYQIERMESKNICFLKDKITNMNFGAGSHKCSPRGVIKYSSRIYTLKHMSNLGLDFLIKKNLQRYQRSAENRKHGMSTHYSNDVSVIEAKYKASLKTCLS